MRIQLKRFLAAACLSLLISACGSGGGSSAEAIGLDPNGYPISLNCISWEGYPNILGTGNSASCSTTTSTAVSGSTTYNLTLNRNQTVQLGIGEYIGGSQASAAYDVVTITAVGSRGYFDGSAGQYVQIVHLDGSGMVTGHTYTAPSTAGNATITFKSTLMPSLVIMYDFVIQ